jgi:hypothetical protein
MEKIKFMQIVINGITDKLNQNDLAGYFYREFRKAHINELYDQTTFFQNCLDVTSIFKRQLKLEYQSQITEINRFRKNYEDYTMKFRDPSPLTQIERCDLALKEKDQQIAALDKTKVNFDLGMLIGFKGKYFIYLSDVETIESGIENAKIKCIENNEKKDPTKFKSILSDECLIKIMQLLMSKEKQLSTTDAGLWLYWFNRNPMFKNPTQLIWNGSATMLANVMSTICGIYQTVAAKTAFKEWKKGNVSKSGDNQSNLVKEINAIILINTAKK